MSFVNDEIERIARNRLNAVASSFGRRQDAGAPEAKHVVAPIPPMEGTEDRFHASMNLFSSLANSFLCVCRGDVIGRVSLVLASLTVAVSICFFLNNNAVLAQETQQSSLQTQEQPQTPTEQADPAAQVDEQDLQRIREFAKRLPPFLRSAVDPGREPGVKRPLLAFRHWAHERKPFVATFLFCLFIGLIGSAFFPKQIAVAQECVRKQFWRCLGRAILVGVTILFAVRILNWMAVTTPLATLLIGVVQLITFAGLAVGIWLIGERIVVRTKLDNTEFFKAHPKIASFTKILIGSLCIALIVQIPGFGLLPRIGIRTALLIAILGAGGLLKTRFGTQPASSD